MKTYIINVSTNEIRRNHMLSQIEGRACLQNYEFIHEGDLSALTEKDLHTYFGGELHTLNAGVSCVYKHMASYWRLLKSDDNLALIFEDDIYLNKDFCASLEKIIHEIKTRNLKNFVISLEDSNLKYVKGSLRKPNTYLYKQARGRMAGAYLIDKAAAASMDSDIKANKVNYPIDWFHNHSADKGIIDIYWAQPPMAIQGSLNGKIKSTLDAKKSGKFRVLTFTASRFYKKLLYRLR